MGAMFLKYKLIYFRYGPNPDGLKFSREEHTAVALVAQLPELRRI